ncbi:hypothetical protein VTL71DRAFT_14239 [Oculimacula yallundae]|uniref:Uncharacterized protein n=1 Tax=Oculimacula yallundae TaxID=86028 RepID=A0ABR4CHW5_9HELO
MEKTRNTFNHSACLHSPATKSSMTHLIFLIAQHEIPRNSSYPASDTGLSPFLNIPSPMLANNIPAFGTITQSFRFSALAIRSVPE